MYPVSAQALRRKDGYPSEVLCSSVQIVGPERVRQKFSQTEVKLAGSVTNAEDLAVGSELVQDLPASATGGGRGLGGCEDDNRSQLDGA